MTLPGATPGATVGELGEFALIAAVRARLPGGNDLVIGPGDDAAVLRAPGGHVVATTDLLVEKRHFRRDWSTAYDVGRKAAAQNLADIAAMGAVATTLLVGLGVPPDLPAQWALDLADGINDECELVGASVAGGDVVRSDAIVVAVTALGQLAGHPAVTRAGARSGDVVAICGRLGWSAAGLAVLSRGFRSPRVLVEAHRRPEPPYAAGPQAAASGATAMIDVSDGLVQDLGHVARASGVSIDLSRATLQAEVAQPLRDVAAAVGGDPLSWVLTGGEDHALAACFAAESALPEGWRVVGSVHAGEGVTVDGKTHDASGGWDHFR